MTQSETVILAAAIGASAAVIGTVVAGIISYYGQRALLGHEVHRARTRFLFEKRLTALQNLVFAIDFVERMKGHEMVDDFGIRTWQRLNDEVACNLAFIPKQFRSDFDLVVRSLYAGVAIDARRGLDYGGLARAKAAVLCYIDSEFEDAGT
jgi:hypothetical protein